MPKTRFGRDEHLSMRNAQSDMTLRQLVKYFNEIVRLAKLLIRTPTVSNVKEALMLEILKGEKLVEDIHKTTPFKLSNLENPMIELEAVNEILEREDHETVYLLRKAMPQLRRLVGDFRTEKAKQPKKKVTEKPERANRLVT